MYVCVCVCVCVCVEERRRCLTRREVVMARKGVLKDLYTVLGGTCKRMCLYADVVQGVG